MTATENFIGVRGHTQAQARLQRAISRGQLHHGLIFIGPRGIGRATLARGLAKALHCQVAPTRGCGACPSCMRIDSGNHPGVEWIRPDGAAGSIKVAAARALATRLESAPFEGRHHVVVFDPAEALGDAAFNALLKAIEEPRPGVHFVMIATALDALLPTILSRCLPVRLGRLDDATVAEIVREQLGATGEATAPSPLPDQARVELAVRLSEGSAGRAVELALDASLDSAVALLRAVTEAADAGPEKIFAGDKSPLWLAWTEAVGPGATGRPARERAAAARVAELWLLHLRERMRKRSGLPGVPPGSGDPNTVLRRLDQVQAFLDALDRNPNVRLSLEQTLLIVSTERGAQ